ILFHNWDFRSQPFLKQDTHTQETIGEKQDGKEKCVRISKERHKDGRRKGVGYTASATILHHYPTHY
ncbi:hypothetical protein, partial [Bacteroides finegoldii]